MDCKDSASYLLGQRLCFDPLSKDVVDGSELRKVLEGPVEVCRERECVSYKFVHELHLNITINRTEPEDLDCQALPSDRLNGRLSVCNLVHTLSSSIDVRRSRAFHGGDFTWIDSTNGIVVEGSLSGITNAGTHRLPLPPPRGCEQPCQRCSAPGFMEGRFCGSIRLSAFDGSLVGAQVVGLYKLQFDGRLKDDRADVIGVMEGGILFEVFDCVATP
jgi:hypothetical protein